MASIGFRGFLLFGTIVFPLIAESKCPPGSFWFNIKQSSGATNTVYPDTSGEDANWDYFDQFGTIHLGPGDTLLVHMLPGVCFSWGIVILDGDQFLTASPGNVVKCVSTGTYEAVNCDEGCNRAYFSIAPLTGAVGPVGLMLNASLEGATTSSSSGSMRTDLKIQGLIPAVEPYSAMGYVHTGGGGGEMLGPGSGTKPIVDWVIVEIRSASSPGSIVASKSAIIFSNGNIVDASTFDNLRFGVAPGYDYVAIRHRNHLGVMTDSPVLLCGISSITISFMVIGTPTYGTDAAHEVGNHKRLWSGNSLWSSGAQQIKYTGSNNDRDPILSKIGGTVPTATTTGYWLEDTNLDGIVKYTGANNDRDLILQTIGGSVPTATRTEQIPY